MVCVGGSLGGRWLLGVLCGGLVVWAGWCNTVTSFLVENCEGIGERKIIFIWIEKKILRLMEVSIC